MKNTIIAQLVIFLFFVSNLNAQQNATESSERPQYVYLVGYGTTIPIYVSSAGSNNQASFSGSVYLNDGFQQGRMVIYDTIELSEAQFRLNTQVNQMEMQFENELSAIAKPDKVNLLEIGDKRFVFRVINDKGTQRNAWVEEVYSGKTKLYKYYFCYLEKEMHRKAMDVGNGELRMIQDSKYLIQFGDTPAVALPKYKKRAGKLFKGHEKEVLNFMKKNKIAPKHEDEIIRIIKYYDGIN